MGGKDKVTRALQEHTERKSEMRTRCKGRKKLEEKKDEERW